jgi:hypothetical protein
VRLAYQRLQRVSGLILTAATNMEEDMSDQWHQLPEDGITVSSRNIVYSKYISEIGSNISENNTLTFFFFFHWLL